MPSPANMAALAELAEACGLHHVLVYDHVVGIDRGRRPDFVGPYDVHDPFHEPLVFLGHLAGRVSLELWTGVLVLPQRQTVVVAKQAAQVDLLCSGNLRLGVGTGWNAAEYEALGEDFATRAVRYEEQVDLLRRLWTEEVVDFEGRFHRVRGAGLAPMPRQRPIPLWMGGGTGTAVLERIGRLADGWIAAFTRPGPSWTGPWPSCGSRPTGQGVCPTPSGCTPSSSPEPTPPLTGYVARPSGGGKRAPVTFR